MLSGRSNGTPWSCAFCLSASIWATYSVAAFCRAAAIARISAFRSSEMYSYRNACTR